MQTAEWPENCNGNYFWYPIIGYFAVKGTAGLGKCVKILIRFSRIFGRKGIRKIGPLPLFRLETMEIQWLP